MKPNVIILEETCGEADRLCNALYELGEPFDLQTAHDAQTALRMVRARPPYAAVLVTELRLPKIDALEALEEIRRDSTFCSLPVVTLVSGQIRRWEESTVQYLGGIFRHKPRAHSEYLRLAGEILQLSKIEKCCDPVQPHRER